jgi:hypothetical protein
LLPAASVSSPSDTALGDWYVNRIVVDRKPLLLLVSAAALFPIVLPARGVRFLPSRLATILATQLDRLGIEPGIIGAECEAMNPVVVAPTADRSVLGIMVDFAKAMTCYSGDLRTQQGLDDLADWLAETPCHAAQRDERVVFPNRKAAELLRAKWLANMPLQPTSGGAGWVH